MEGKGGGLEVGLGKKGRGGRVHYHMTAIGHLNPSTEHLLRNQAGHFVGEPGAKVILDLMDIQSISESGWALLGDLGGMLRRNKGEMVLVNLPKHIQGKDVLFGEDGTLRLFPSHEEAMRYLDNPSQPPLF